MSTQTLTQLVKFNYHIFDGMYENEPYSPEQYKERLKGKNPIIFTVKKDKKLVANSISFEKDNSFYIWILAVDKNYRGQGIGASLLDKNEQFAKENGYKSVSTKVYNVSKEMKRLLKQRNYKIVKRQKSKTNSKFTALIFTLSL
jgi:ribosomal protein S18 acetylase RimI-like enzyme